MTANWLFQRLQSFTFKPTFREVNLVTDLLVKYGKKHPQTTVYLQ